MIEEKPPITTVTQKFVGEDGHPLTLTNIAIIVLIVAISAPLLLVVGHALPLLDMFFQGMKPLMEDLGFVVALAFFAFIGLTVWYVHDLFRIDIQRRSIQAHKFSIDGNGHYPALYSHKTGSFIGPDSREVHKPVPQSLTFAPRTDYRLPRKIDDAIDALPLEQGEVQRPSVEELVSKIERNSFQIALGKSLTTTDILIAELTDTHLKIIGSTRMGKSCQAGAILAQIEQTHDPDRLQFALLDLEYKTSRLFEKSDHLVRLGKGAMHAKSIDEVPVYLHYLVQELERRDRLSMEELEKLPHILIYLEEFLDLKKRLKAQGGKTCIQFLTDFNTLATRGLKLGLHIMACAQVDYADEDLKDAMAQFIGVNIAFGVKPTAAMAAGFINSELLSKNYEKRIPGQFVVEMIGASDLGIAPDFDVKEKLKSLHETRVLGTRETVVLETQPKHSRNEQRNELEPALQAKLRLVMEIPGENMRDCIKRVWGASPGYNEGWRNAKAEYEEILKVIHQLALKGMGKE